MRELEARERLLRKEMQRLQETLDTHPAQDSHHLPPIEVMPPPAESNRRKIPNRQSRHTPLGVERRRIRRRVLGIALIVIVLALLIYRLSNG